MFEHSIFLHDTVQVSKARFISNLLAPYKQVIHHIFFLQF